MIVLGIDQAAVSGWALVRRVPRAGMPTVAPDAHVLAHGTVRTALERREVISRAIDEAAMGKLVAVYEAHTPGGGARWNPTTILGMGTARGRWLEALELAGMPQRCVIGVSPQTWRAAMIGGPQRPTDRWKADALRLVSRRGVREITSSDEAEALLIALWGATRSAEVAKLAAKRRAA